MWGFELVVMALMIVVNAVFAAYEIALASATPGRLRRLKEESRRGAHDALHMKENMEASLAVVQLGITLVGAVAAAVGGAGAGEKLTPWLVSVTGLTEPTARYLALACMVVPLTIITIIFGELIPKVFALRNTEAVCLRLSPPMRWFSFSVWPAVWFFETSTTALMSWGERRMGRNDSQRGELVELQDLRAAAALARASRLIGHRQEGIILGAAEMQSRPVGEIMLPAEHISTMDAQGSLNDNLIASHLDMHTRFPVEEVKGNRQTIIGYVNVKDLILALRMQPVDGSFRSVIRPVPELQASQPILACLERLMREHTHIAVVRDATHTIVGMVTLEDIIEELVGDIRDEYDRLPNHLVPTGKAWVVGGGVPLDRFNAVTGYQLAALDPERTGTVSEWVAAALGREVRSGDVIEADGVRVVVRKVRRQQLQEASCTKAMRDLPPSPARTDGSAA